jgi:hypothetical protein
MLGICHINDGGSTAVGQYLISRIPQIRLRDGVIYETLAQRWMSSISPCGSKHVPVADRILAEGIIETCLEAKGVGTCRYVVWRTLTAFLKYAMAKAVSP